MDGDDVGRPAFSVAAQSTMKMHPVGQTLLVFLLKTMWLWRKRLGGIAKDAERRGVAVETLPEIEEALKQRIRDAPFSAAE